MSDMASITYNGETISYYPDDLNYSYTVMGVGYETGNAYNLTFDDDGNLVEVENA